MNVREYLEQKGTLLFDGGMGTCYAARNRSGSGSCELGNLNRPELVSQIHREYIEAGAKAIKTNTFAANRINYGDEALVDRIIGSGWQLALQSAGEDSFVFADIGPVLGLENKENTAKELQWLADRFLELGAENFLFETNSAPDGLAETAAYIKNRRPEAFVMISFAVQPDGYTRQGHYAADLLTQMKQCRAVDAVGFNCVSGAGHMLQLVQGLNLTGITLSVMPNAGYPEIRGGKVYYDGDPEYFAENIARIAAAGAAIVGGCCGTSPVHIAACAERLAAMPVNDRKAADQTAQKQRRDPVISPFWEKLRRGEKVIAVELDPPADAMPDKFMSGAWQLKGAGADIITIADCPIARARMDAGILACKLHRELGIDALPHMTCRDRNLNATKALIFGLYAEGIRNVLLVTGDPIPTAERDEVKSVYQFNSRKLAAYVSSLAEKSLPGELHLFGALNVNAHNFGIQLKMAKEKEANGMIGFLTQPVLTHQAFLNLQEARKELKGCLLGGIMPVVSAKNARFMDSEINGINVDPQITALYEGKNRAEGEELAVTISAEIARRIAPFVDGWYFMTPFGRTGLMAQILEEIQKQGE